MPVLPQLLALNESYQQRFLPHISVDCAVFGFNGKTLQVLLLRLKGDEDWFLPGGYVEKEEDIDVAAQRTLFERIGVKNVFLEQFSVFGKPNRSETYFEVYPNDLWGKKRFVSVGYYALVNQEMVEYTPDEFSDECAWKNIDELPGLVMDHREIIEKALKTLRQQLSYNPIGYNLLQEEFTMPELQALYEGILGRKLNRGNFYRKIMHLGILDKTDKIRTGGAYKSPILYRFNEKHYNAALGQISWI